MAANRSDARQGKLRRRCHTSIHNFSSTALNIQSVSRRPASVPASLRPSRMRRWLHADSSDPAPPAKRGAIVQAIGGRTFVPSSDDEGDEDAAVWDRRSGAGGGRSGTSERSGVPASPECPTFTVDLNAHVLRMRASSVDMPVRGNITKREHRAMNPDRLESVLRSRCSCTQECLPNMNALQADLLQVLQWWHGPLTRSDRTFLLSTLFDPDALRSDRITRATWSICGRHICLDAFCKLLGSHKSTIQHMAHGIPHHHIVPPRESRQTQRTHQFFLELYMSAAEPMPHENYMVKGRQKCTPTPITLDRPCQPAGPVTPVFPCVP